MQTKKTEIWVGVFLLVALLAALFVCLKAANVTRYAPSRLIAFMRLSITSAA